ncbi:hypothetical protein ScPMuIL_004005 [Solemya velum]
MKLFILAVLVTYVAATPLIGSNKCTWGPGYWCSHVSHAKQCGAMEHCLERFWPKQQLNTKATATCTVCKVAFGELRSNLKYHATQKDVSSFLSRFCTVLPADQKEKCKAMIKDIPEVMQLLDSHISTEVMCAAIDLCHEDYAVDMDTETTTKAPTTKATTEPTDKMCTDCEALVQDIKDQLTDNQTRGEIIQALEQVICAKMGPLKGICDDLVEKYVPQYLNVLAGFVNPDQLCTALGFCQNGDAFLVNMMLHKQLITSLAKVTEDVSASSKACQICETFVTDLQNVVKDTTVQNDIVWVLETDVCANLGPLASLCKQYVDQYTPMFLNALVSMLNPDTLCKNIGLCAMGDDFSAFLLRPENMLVKLHPAEQRTENLVKIQPAIQYTPEAGPTCEICQLIMTELETVLAKNETVMTIEQALKKVCTLLPGGLESECTDLVSVYGPIIVQLVINDIPFNQICKELGICSSANNQEMSMSNVGGVCTVCKLSVKYLQSFITDNATQQNKDSAQVLAEFDYLCTLLPSPYSGECTNLVDTYGLALLNYIANLSPDVVCAFLQLCSAPPPPQGMPKVEEDVCDMCTLVLTAAKDLISNMTDDQLVAAMEQVCDAVPSQFQEDCKELVELVGKTIADYILNADPKTVCAMLGLCSGTKEPLPKMPEVEENVCDMCTLILTAAKDLISNMTDDQIVAAMEQVCDALPTQIQAECKELIDMVGKSIADYILNADPKTICAMLGLCSGPKQPVQFKLSVCEVCTSGVSMVKNILSGITEDQIIADLEKICSIIPSQLKDDCIQYMDAAGKSIADFIMNIDPTVFCTDIGACSAMKRLSVIRPSTMLNKLQKSSETCKICKLVATGLEYLLKDNATTEEIKTALNLVCGLIGPELSGECRNFTAEYEAAIISILIAELKPEKICVYLKVCPKSTGKVLSLPKKPKGTVTGPDCVMCKLVISKLEEMLDKNSSTEDIKAALEKVCSLLPSTLSKECDDFIEKYATTIIQLLEEELDPKAICRLLGLCSAQGTWTPPQPKPEETKLYYSKDHLLGAKDCTHGPSFWCSSPENARKCNAEKYCVSIRASVREP